MKMRQRREAKLQGRGRHGKLQFVCSTSGDKTDESTVANPTQSSPRIARIVEEVKRGERMR